MRQWAATGGVGSAALPTGTAPSLAVAAAAELVKSMLHIGAVRGSMGALKSPLVWLACNQGIGESVASKYQGRRPGHDSSHRLLWPALPPACCTGAGSAGALVGRFSEEEIKAAFGLLSRQGHINPPAGKAKAMQLSDDFRSKLRVGGGGLGFTA